MSTNAKIKNKKLPTFRKALPYILVIGGVIGFIMSAVLMYDHQKISQNPNYIPNCNLNPIIACGSVIKSSQAEAFHFPNTYIGLVAYPIVITTGMALFAGAKFKRWYWLGLQAGTIFGIGLIHWLFFQTVYRINALCPYCMGAWVVTITIFWYVLLHNMQTGNIRLPVRIKSVQTFFIRHHLDILVLWFLIIAALILQHFWYYYGKYLQ